MIHENANRPTGDRAARQGLLSSGLDERLADNIQPLRNTQAATQPLVIYAAAAHKHITAPSALDVFIARAEARAILWQAGEFELHDAVDELQAAAERDGLVDWLGQDAIQQILAEAFGAVR